MKVIIAGATGFIGAEVLRQCRTHPDILTIYTLTRRPLPGTVEKDSKVVSVVLQNFTEIPENVRTRLQEADAVIWTLRAANAEVECWPVHFAKAINPKRFIHVSGILAERDQDKSLWFLQNGRRLKGQVELDLINLSKPSTISDVYVIRPAMVQERVPSLLSKSMGSVLGAIRVDDLSAVMVYIALSGADKDTFEQVELTKLAASIPR